MGSVLLLCCIYICISKYDVLFSRLPYAQLRRVNRPPLCLPAAERCGHATVSVRVRSGSEENVSGILVFALSLRMLLVCGEYLHTYVYSFVLIQSNKCVRQNIVRHALGCNPHPRTILKAMRGTPYLLMCFATGMEGSDVTLNATTA